MNTKEVLAIILGGGKGTRLYPLTKYRAKPAVPFAGKFRIIDLAVSNCLNSDINKIYLLTQFNTHSLHRHLNDTYRLGRFSRGFVDILAAEQTSENRDWYQGTADAVRQNLQYIESETTKYTLVLSGDHLYRMDYRDFLETHFKKKSEITISVKPVSEEEASDFGILKTDENGRIIEFREKPARDQLHTLKSPGLPEETPYLASMGIYLFNTDKLIDNLQEIKLNDFGHHIIPKIIHSKTVYVHPYKGYWKDIGTIKAFFEANLEMASSNPPFAFYDEEAPFYTHPRYLPCTTIESSEITQSLIADGCYVINSKITNAIIGLRSKINSNTIINNSILMGADYFEDDVQEKLIPIGIGENCIIKNAIIDKNVRIGNNVKIINRDKIKQKDDEIYSIREGIIVVPKGSIIPDNTVI